MKKIEFEMSPKFRTFCIKNCVEGISARKVITELLKNKGVTKPRDLKMDFCSLGDLKVNGKTPKSVSMNIIGGKIIIEV